MKKKYLLLTLLSMITLASCGGNNSKPVEEKVLTSIFVFKNPSKLDYFVGETFSSSGSQVVATFSDNSEQDVTWLVDWNPKTPLTLENNKATATYTYQNVSKETSISISVTEMPIEIVTLQSIEVIKKPTKIDYYVGEYFDPTGCEVKANFSNGTSKILSNDEITWAPKYKLGLNDKTAIVSYEYHNVIKSASVNISVTEPIEEKTLDRIEIVAEPTKLSYYEGEYFDPAGSVVKAYFTNGETTILKENDLYWTPNRALLITDDCAVVSYTFNGISRTDSVSISVISIPTEVTLQSLTIKTPPNKLDYNVDDYFDPTGVVCIAKFSNGTKLTLNADDVEWNLKSKLTINDKEAIASYTYKGITKTDSVVINVVEVKLDRIEIESNPSKLLYREGEYFDPLGLKLKAFYSNNTSMVIDLQKLVWSITRSLVCSDSKIEASYTFRDVTKSVSFGIKVIPNLRGAFFEKNSNIELYPNEIKSLTIGMSYSFDVNFVNNGYIALLFGQKEWGRYFGYYYFYSDGHSMDVNGVDNPKGITSKELDDGYIRFSVTFSELNIIDGDGAPSTFGLLYGVDWRNDSTDVYFDINVSDYSENDPYLSDIYDY